MVGSARSTPPVERRRCPGIYTNCGGAPLNRYNPDSHCGPCEDQRRDLAAESAALPGSPARSGVACTGNDSLPGLPPEQRKKVDDVLAIALALLRPGREPDPAVGAESRSARNTRAPTPHVVHGHGAIAAAFATRFIMPGWRGPLADELRRVHEALARARQEPGWRFALHDFEEPLVRHGLQVRVDTRDFRAPPDGPDVAVATALSFPDARVFPGNLGFTVHVWSGLLSKEDLCRGIARAMDRWRAIVSDPTLHREAVRLAELGSWDVGRRGRRKTSFDATFREFRRRPVLPHIEFSLAGNVPPSMEMVADWYEGLRKCWQHRLWDGEDERKRRRGRTRERLLRGWALYLLTVHAELKPAEALAEWNDFTQRSGRVDLEQGHEGNASDERTFALETAERLRVFLSHRPKILR